MLMMLEVPNANQRSASEGRVGNGLRLLVVPALQVFRDSLGREFATRKFIDGIRTYARYWGGPIDVAMEASDKPSPHLDNELIQRSSPEFTMHVLRFDEPDMLDLIKHASVVLSTAHYRQAHLVRWCEASGVPLVLHSELTLKTRWQIARAEEAIWWRRMRRLQWEYMEERRLRRVVGRCAGVQCAGTPTYEAYRSLNSDALLYFDSRTTSDMVIADHVLGSRISHLLSIPAPPLRLVFSGRLADIKGVQYLPQICRRLLDLGVEFGLTVYGDGPLKPILQDAIERLEISSVMHLAGAVDYGSELVPAVSSTADLFVCTHLQGDPSCTYLETLACGVPIVGTANEAWAGMLRQGVDGWSVPVGDWDGLAAKIADLARDRVRLAEASRAAREFALVHTFEETFRRRVEHLDRLARRPLTRRDARATAPAERLSDRAAPQSHLVD
jgi:glycosyltransferase involved in cell wall biosynthesis